MFLQPRTQGTVSPEGKNHKDAKSNPKGGNNAQASPARGCSKYPATASEYELLEEVGRGGSAVVWKARCRSTGEIVAIKDLDLEKCTNSDLESVHKEAQMMKMTSHPNLVHAHAFFSVGQHLWVVMPFCDVGSVMQVMKACHPNGLEEPVAAVILHEALKGLEYLHRTGHIHRDIKAGNILLNSDGRVRLADFGVSAVMFGGNTFKHQKSFVGTPLWMAPELLLEDGYDAKADIWSFGITALELAHGHAPFYNNPPQKIFLHTIQDPPPGLDKEHEKKFSKAFKEMVAMCLVKDPSKRPSAEKLLKHSFFKHAKTPDYLVKHLLKDLPSIEQQLQVLKKQEQALLATKQTSLRQQEQESQQEYEQSLSVWDFDLGKGTEERTGGST